MTTNRRINKLLKQGVADVSYHHPKVVQVCLENGWVWRFDSNPCIYHSYVVTSSEGVERITLNDPK